MKREIKRAIVVTLAIGALSSIEPTKYINLTNVVEANAASNTDINANLKLKGIYLSEGKIDFDPNKTEYDIQVARSVEEIKIKAKPKDTEVFEKDGSKCTVKINGAEVTSDDNYERTVSLDKGDNSISIKLSNGKSKSKTYTLNIKRGTASSNDDEKDDNNEDENIYLSDISLSSGIVNFSKETKTYDVKVDSSVDKIEIKAKPEDSDYKVKIDGVSVNDSDKYKREVELKEGTNTVELFIKDGLKENTYTLNITRGTNKSENTSNISTNIKANQWVQVNNKWQYNDSTGNPLRDVWFYDRKNGKNYYLQADGTMATGWLYKDGIWYYLGQNGEKQTGWALDGGIWYYLNGEGRMQTGWLKDQSGKWYFLQPSGAMAKDTVVGGYKLGSNGAWVK